MGFKIEHPSRPLLLLGAVMALVLAAIYFATLSPAFPPDDSPETIAAAVTLGIQHPPGYPLPVLLGRCAVAGLDLGAPAWRVNALSAVLAVVVALLSGCLALRLAPEQGQGFRRGAWIFTVLATGLGTTLWDQATEAKGGIYLLNLALGLGLWLSVLEAQAGSRRACALAGLLAGLMLAGHFLSAALWAGPLGLWMLWGRRQGRVRGLGAAVLLLLPGVALYGVLPLRAALDPWVDLGHPVSWRQFWWVLSRSGYSQEGLGPAGPIIRDQLGLWSDSLLRGLAWGTPLLALGGALWLRRARPQWTWLLLGTLALDVVAGGVVNRTPADNRWLALIFLLPATLLLLPLAGLGLAAWAGERWRGALLPLLAVVLPLGAAAANARSADRSGSFTAWDYARDLALSLPKNALYLAEGDYHTLPLVHLQAVEGRRRDVAMLVNPLAGEPWYQAQQSRRNPDLRWPGSGPADAVLPRLAKANADRAVMVSPFSRWLNAASLAPWPLRQWGLPRRSGPVAGLAVPELAPAWAARAPRRAGRDLEAIEAGLLPWYGVALVQDGNEALAAGQPARALRDYRRALGRPGELPRAGVLYNTGQAWESLKAPDQARQAYEAALAVDPGFPMARQRLTALDQAAAPAARTLLKRADALALAGGRDLEALQLYQQALATGYQSAVLWRNIGVLCLRQGRATQAVKAFQQGLRVAPGDPTLTQYILAAQSAAASR